MLIRGRVEVRVRASARDRLLARSRLREDTGTSPHL